MALLRNLQSIPGGLGLLRASGRATESRAREVFGIQFPNPVGLAAGFDKNARVIHAMAALGFGFVEIGTVTPRPQPGNPKPRMFRLTRERSLQNALGFNNDGAHQIAERLKRNAPYPIPVGINIGKNKDTPDDRAADDYCECMTLLESAGDYFVVNVSSPNTPGLRALQSESFLGELFPRLRALTAKPILLKLSPDESPDALAILAEAAVKHGAAGIIATNTTTDYTLTPNAKNFGGISGCLLREKSRAALRTLASAVPDTPLVSVGGIDSPEEAQARLDAGASLVELYTGLIYEGPSLPSRIARAVSHQTSS